MHVAAQITSFADVTANDEQQLLQVVAQQPVSVNIAVAPEFHQYSEGIQCNTNTNSKKQRASTKENLRQNM